MMFFLLATVYPGGGVALISALLWLIATLLAPLTLMAGFLGIWTRREAFACAIKRLKFAMGTSLLALLLLIVETSSVGWDAWFVLKDSKYFFDQVPINLIRAGSNLAVLFLSWMLDGIVRKKAW